MKLSFPAWHTHEGAGAYFTPYCSTWASTAWIIRMGKEIDRERETGDRVLELYLQCIITLVFRPGPTEPSFWTWPCISFIFLVISFFPLLYFLLQFSPIETHSCNASVVSQVWISPYKQRYMHVLGLTDTDSSQIGERSGRFGGIQGTVVSFWLERVSWKTRSSELRKEDY